MLNVGALNCVVGGDVDVDVASALVPALQIVRCPRCQVVAVVVVVELGELESMESISESIVVEVLGAPAALEVLLVHVPVFVL